MFRSARDVDGAIDEIGRWADSLPGDFAIEVTDYADGAVIAVTGLLMSSGLALRAWVHLDESALVHQYRFHVQDSGGQLVWRQDNHPGHETDPGMRGPEHVHRLRDGEEVRVPADPVDLVVIRDALIQANVEHAP